MSDNDTFPKISVQDIFMASRPIRRLCGVYFLIKSDEIIYVGKSINSLSRVGSHIDTKNFDRAAFLEVPESDLEEAEKYYIETLMPQQNRCKISNKAKKNNKKPISNRFKPRELRERHEMESKLIVQSSYETYKKVIGDPVFLGMSNQELRVECLDYHRKLMKKCNSKKYMKAYYKKMQAEAEKLREPEEDITSHASLNKAVNKIGDYTFGRGEFSSS